MAGGDTNPWNLHFRPHLATFKKAMTPKSFLDSLVSKHLIDWDQFESLRKATTAGLAVEELSLILVRQQPPKKTYMEFREILLATERQGYLVENFLPPVSTEGALLMNNHVSDNLNNCELSFRGRFGNRW